MLVESGRKGEVVMLGLTPLGGDTEGEGLTRTQGSSLGRECCKPHIGGPSPGARHQEGSPLDWFENQWDWQG